MGRAQEDVVMTRAFVPFAVLSASLLSLSARGNIRDSSPVVPLSWAVEVYRTYCPELMAEAHIEDCWTGYMNEGLHLVVVTDTPAPRSVRDRHHPGPD